MMNLLNKKIELYLGRKPDFINEVQVVDDGKGNLTIAVWNAKDKTKPTKTQLNSFTAEATKQYNNSKVDEKRKVEYLSWQKQMEMIYKDQKNGTSTYKDHCDKVRSDNPKE